MTSHFHERRRAPLQASQFPALIIFTITAACLVHPSVGHCDDLWDDILKRKTLFGTPAAVDEELDSITTDRPDFTEASSTVGRGVLQIESGYTYIFDKNEGIHSRSHSTPEALFRYGVVADWLELRAAWNVALESVGPDRQSGAEDIYLGAKLALTLQDGVIPEVAVVPQMTLPTGSNSFSANKTLPGMNVLYGWDVNDFLATGGSTQVNQSVDGGTGTTYTEWAQSWTINYSLAKRVGAYTEWFAFFPQDADTAATEHYFDGGFTFRPTKDQQWDVRGGIGLNDAAADYFVGMGYSIRFR